MGLIYFPIHEWLIFVMIHVGKYTRLASYGLIFIFFGGNFMRLFLGGEFLQVSSI